jgi:hypothetical protein
MYRIRIETSIANAAGLTWERIRGSILHGLCYWIRLLGVVARLSADLFARIWAGTARDSADILCRDTL